MERRTLGRFPNIERSLVGRAGARAERQAWEQTPRCLNAETLLPPHILRAAWFSVRPCGLDRWWLVRTDNLCVVLCIFVRSALAAGQVQTSICCKKKRSHLLLRGHGRGTSVEMVRVLNPHQESVQFRAAMALL